MGRMPDLRSRPAALLLAGAVLAVLVAWFLRQRGQGELEQRLRLEAALGALPLGVEAPRVQLFDRADRPVALDSYRGRVVFVNFWATWCGPCRAEMPSLIALRQALDPADIAFVSIAEDDEWPPLDAYLKATPLPFDVYRDRPPRVEERFETRSYPTSFLLDREGRAIYRFNGARDWSAPEVRELLALEGVGPAR